LSLVSPDGVAPSRMVCVCVPLLIFPCTTKSRSSILAPAHPGGPGKRAVKRLWCGGVCVLISVHHLLLYFLTAVCQLLINGYVNLSTMYVPAQNLDVDVDR